MSQTKRRLRAGSRTGQRSPVAFAIPGSNFERDTFGHSRHESVPEKSAGTASCDHVNVDRNRITEDIKAAL